LDIAQHAGTLATIKSHPDMEYADTQVMAAIGLSAAGRAEPEALANVTNSVQSRLGKGVAQRTLKTAERVGTRNRPDLRDGHGIIINANTGEYESAYSEKNFNSRTAVGSVTSVKGSDWSGAKAEAVQAAQRTLVYVASGQAATDRNADPDDAITILQSITQGITNPYNDAGQRKAWAEVARQSGHWSPQDVDQLMEQGLRARQSLGDGQVLGAGDDGGDGGAPGTPPAA
jgi:hypothetical protein